MINLVTETIEASSGVHIDVHMCKFLGEPRSRMSEKHGLLHFCWVAEQSTFQPQVKTVGTACRGSLHLELHLRTGILA